MNMKKLDITDIKDLELESKVFIMDNQNQIPLGECILISKSLFKSEFIAEKNLSIIKNNESSFSTDALEIITYHYDNKDCKYSIFLKEINDQTLVSTEKEITFDEVIKNISYENFIIRVESAVFDDIKDNAIDYEDEVSMSDEQHDSLENFLNKFLQNEYNTVQDIIKFISFYGDNEEIKELIENGRWFVKR